MKAAVIGTGQISRQHLACLREMRGVEIAGVCDLSRTVAEAAADRFAVKRWFTDHRAMLNEVRPDVVHVTTPPSSHLELATDAMAGGAHVVVEKPATTSFAETLRLLEVAGARSRTLVENYNYVFAEQVLAVQRLIREGRFGQVVHVEALVCLPLFAPGSPFADPNTRHHSSAVSGGAIADFLPHLASIAHAFVGPHRSVRTIWDSRSHASECDEFRALINAERGTAVLGVSAHGQPDQFYLRVEGTKMRASANLFEPRLVTEEQRNVPKPLVPVLNGLTEARQVRRGAFGGLRSKLSGGPGSYGGLWELLRRTYQAIETRTPPPVSLQDIRAVNALVNELGIEENRL